MGGFERKRAISAHRKGGKGINLYRGKSSSKKILRGAFGVWNGVGLYGRSNGQAHCTRKEGIELGGETPRWLKTVSRRFKTYKNGGVG